MRLMTQRTSVCCSVPPPQAANNSTSSRPCYVLNMQVLADALGDLQNPCLGLSTEYPWAMAIAGYTALLTFCAEYAIGRILWARYGAASTKSEACFRSV